MTRPLRYRSELGKGIGQHKGSSNPLTVDDLVGIVCLIGTIFYLVWLVWFSMEV